MQIKSKGLPFPSVGIIENIQFLKHYELILDIHISICTFISTLLFSSDLLLILIQLCYKILKKHSLDHFIFHQPNLF